MTISVLTTQTYAMQRQDPFIEALRNYLDFADEVVIVDGDKEGLTSEFVNRLMRMSDSIFSKIKLVNYEWPDEFEWSHIGKAFQKGYEAATGKFVVKLDLDQFIHEDDFEAIREFSKGQTAPVCRMPKKQFLRCDYFKAKAHLPFVLNKGKYGDRIRLDSGIDLCEPSIDGEHIDLDTMPIVARKIPIVISDSVTPEQIKNRVPNYFIEGGVKYTYTDEIPIWNYDKSFCDKKVIAKEFARFGRAWKRTFGNTPFSEGDESKSLDEFMRLMKGRWSRHGWTKCELEDHPKYVQELIKNLTPDRFGFNGFGELNA